MYNWARSAERITEYFNKPGAKVTLGIDGYIDEVWQIVETRKSAAEYKLYDKINDFTKAVDGTGGSLNEIIRKRRSYGGFTCNTGKAVGRLGCDLTMLGMFGKDTIEPLYQEFQANYKMFSVGNPGVGEVFEFLDGKIMLTHTEETSSVSWSQLTSSLSMDTLSTIFGKADIVGLGYWALLRNFDDLATKLCEHFLEKGKCSRLFFDFSDIRKHKKQALLDTLNTLYPLNKKVPMTLSVNEHEAKLLFSYMGRGFAQDDPKSAEKDIDHVRQQTGLDELVVHTPYFSVASTVSEEVATVIQRYCKDPVITTGAGDNFNGGYVAASALKGELNLAERLLVGNATTGYYIRHGYSPDKAGLRNEINELLKEQI